MNPSVKLRVNHDRKQMLCAGNIYSHYKAEIINTYDSYPFGMLMEERKGQFLADSVKVTNNSAQTPVNCLSSGEFYRYGHNGKEKDDDMYGVEGTSYTAEYWQYDSRLARMWNVDWFVKPWRSPCDVCYNNPIFWIALNGDCNGIKNT